MLTNAVIARANSPTAAIVAAASAANRWTGITISRQWYGESIDKLAPLVTVNVLVIDNWNVSWQVRPRELLDILLLQGLVDDLGMRQPLVCIPAATLVSYQSSKE